MKWRAVGFLMVVAVVVFAVGVATSGGERLRVRYSVEINPTPVLVANQLIPKGTSGLVVAYQSMYAPTTLPEKEIASGAISDPRYLRGRAAAVEIVPGQQLTETNLTASDASASP